MPQAASRQTCEILLRSLVYGPVLLLLCLQLWQAKRSSGRAVGFFASEVDEAVEIDSTRPRGPADEAGLRAGDVLLEVASRPIRTLAD